LHPHNQTRCTSVTENFIGTIELPLWEPSQKGCRLDRPQAHHQ
jgi:hypothetical protein